jgi:hypothetical protein
MDKIQFFYPRGCLRCLHCTTMQAGQFSAFREASNTSKTTMPTDARSKAHRGRTHQLTLMAAGTDANERDATARRAKGVTMARSMAEKAEASFEAREKERERCKAAESKQAIFKLRRRTRAETTTPG